MVTGKSSTPEIMANSGTHGRTRLPQKTADLKLKVPSKLPTNGSQQWATTTRKQARMRRKSTQAMWVPWEVSGWLVLMDVW